jgi:hypothetical protein
VSLYLATHPVGKEGEQDVIRLKNLLREAEHKLSGNWMRAPKARDLLERAASLPVDFSFWRKRSDGLAVFIAPNLFEAYRVPVSLAQQVSVTSRFRVRPLLPLLEQCMSLFLLTISDNQVAIYSVDEQSIEKLDVPGLPTNLTETLNYTGADRGSQVHSAMPRVKRKQAAVFHGQGGQPDTMKDDQLAYCAAIDKAVFSFLRDSTDALMLACVDRLADLYRRKNSYKHLLSQTLAGNHDHASEHELREAAWRRAQPLLKSEARKTAVRYADLLGTNKACDRPCEIVSAAFQGRVDALLYDPQAELFGECDTTGNNIQVTGRADDADFVDLAAVETLRHGGAIHPITGQEIPTNEPLAAIFRF